MKITKVTKEEGEDSYGFSMQCNKAEVEFLLDYAVNSLIREGVISVSGEEEQEVELYNPAH